MSNLSDFPEILKQFNKIANHDIFEAGALRSQSNKKMWWICDKGHDWLARVQDRTQGKGCPACSGRIATRDRNLETERPDLTTEWHEKNPLKPTAFLPSSGKKVWWRCAQGHEWEATIDKRNQGRGCPFCKGKRVTKERNLAVTFPEIAAEWHSIKNGNITPYEVAPVARKKVWWLCEKGHEYDAMVCERTSGGRTCHQCLSLAEKFPEIAAEWHQTLNGNVTPDAVYSKTDKSYYWQCQKNINHVWMAIICSRTGYKKSSCPFCNSSKGEKAIKELLESIKSDYKSQFKFDDCRNKRRLAFDFAIFTDGGRVGLIEYQGEQHFRPVVHWGGEEKFNQVVNNDEIKLAFCADKKMPLLVLRYDDEKWQDKVIEFVDSITLSNDFHDL